MSERLLTDRRAGDAWAFRAKVEREAARRFGRLAAAISELDASSPVPDMMVRAASDERRHAVLCAELAQSYGNPAEGEFPDIDIVPSGLDRRAAVLYEVVAACCVTETESVATLTTLLAIDGEPRVRTVLHEIARDEILHSRMGWAHLAREAPSGVGFLSKWIPAMLAGGIDPELFSVEPPEPPDEPELLHHGVLSRARKRAIFVGTLESVVFPGLEKFGVDPAPARAWLDRSTQT